MLIFIIRRTLLGMGAIIALIIVVFIVTHSLGDPVRIMLPVEASEEMVEAARQRLGLNDPIIVQFWRYITSIATLDFGTSLWQGRSCIDLVIERLPATAILASAAMAWATLLGVTFGALSGIKPRSILDRVLSFVTFSGASSVEFWIGLMLIVIIAVELRWLPTSGYGDWKHLILPMLTLGFRPFGRIAQVTRPALIDEFNKPYVTALKARGFPKGRVVGHALRNSSIVIVTLVGYEFARLFTGATVVVEAVFGWPGVGLLMVQAIERRDWPLIIATTITIAAIVIILNIIIDIIYGWLNPRVRFE